MIHNYLIYLLIKFLYQPISIIIFEKLTSYSKFSIQDNSSLLLPNIFNIYNITKWPCLTNLLYLCFITIISLANAQPEYQKKYAILLSCQLDQQFDSEKGYIQGIAVSVKFASLDCSITAQFGGLVSVDLIAFIIKPKGPHICSIECKNYSTCLQYLSNILRNSSDEIELKYSSISRKTTGVGSSTIWMFLQSPKIKSHSFQSDRFVSYLEDNIIKGYKIGKFFYFAILKTNFPFPSDGPKFLTAHGSFNGYRPSYELHQNCFLGFALNFTENSCNSSDIDNSPHGMNTTLKFVISYNLKDRILRLRSCFDSLAKPIFHLLVKKQIKEEKATGKVITMPIYVQNILGFFELLDLSEEKKLQLEQKMNDFASFDFQKEDTKDKKYFKKRIILKNNEQADVIALRSLKYLKNIDDTDEFIPQEDENFNKTWESIKIVVLFGIVLGGLGIIVYMLWLEVKKILRKRANIVTI